MHRRGIICRTFSQNSRKRAKTHHHQGTDTLSGTVVRRLDKTHSCHGNRQTLTSPSDSVSCLMRIAYVRLLWDMPDFYQTQNSVRWWLQSLSVVWKCLVLDRGLCMLSVWFRRRVATHGYFLRGALSPVSHKGLHQGWTQTSLYLQVIHFRSHHTTSHVSFFLFFFFLF